MARASSAEDLPAFVRRVGRRGTLHNQFFLGLRGQQIAAPAAAAWARKLLQTGNLGVSLTPGCFPPSISMEVVSGAKWPRRGNAPQLATLVRGSRCREFVRFARFFGRRTRPRRASRRSRRVRFSLRAI